MIRSLDLPRVRSSGSVLTTLQHGLRLLGLLAEHRDPLSAKELAALVGVGLDSCYRLLRTLEQEGFVAHLPGKGYVLGGRIPWLQKGLDTHLTPDPLFAELLDTLYAEIDEWVSFNTWEGRDIVLSDARWQGGARAAIAFGYRDYPHARGATKAILSFLPPGELRKFFVGHRLERVTPYTVTELERLLDELREAAGRGYAVDREELKLGYCGLGVPIFGPNRFPIGSFAVGMTKRKFESRLLELRRLLTLAAELASRRLGYTGPYPPPAPRAR